MIRECCGQESVREFDKVAELRKEVGRLQGLLEDTARWFRDSGHPVKASLLRKEFDRKTADS